MSGGSIADGQKVFKSWLSQAQQTQQAQKDLAGAEKKQWLGRLGDGCISLPASP
jgi:hypothetical protein